MTFIRDFMVKKGEDMRIAVLSGKGGTGKTLVSVNLASAADSAVYIDCDVEEPDGHLFFKPQIVSSEEIAVKLPSIDNGLCNGCRKCVDFCKFNALAFIKGRPCVFEDVCHSCGGCTLVCPEKAITETDRAIGEIRKGTSGSVTAYTGILKPGEESGVPIIKRIMQASGSEGDALRIIDCPPGSACVVVESIKDADYCILVAEPTVFGVHNLNMVYGLVKLFNKPFGAVLNKCLDGENPAEKFCIENSIPIIGRIPFDTELGKMNSDAEIAARESKKYKELFSDLLRTAMKEARRETAFDTQR